MELLKEYATWENLKTVLWLLFGSGIVCQITPFIKFNPISLVLNWIGKQLNKDVKEDIKILKDDVKNVQSELQNHIVESWRRNILCFADELMAGSTKTKENFVYVIGLHDKYEKYISEHNIENGQITLAFEYISSKYKECLENNSFKK